MCRQVQLATLILVALLNTPCLNAHWSDYSPFKPTWQCLTVTAEFRCPLYVTLLNGGFHLEGELTDIDLSGVPILGGLNADDHITREVADVSVNVAKVYLHGCAMDLAWFFIENLPEWELAVTHNCFFNSGGKGKRKAVYALPENFRGALYDLGIVDLF